MTDELIGIIGGTGLGDALTEHIDNAELHDIDTPADYQSWSAERDSAGGSR